MYALRFGLLVGLLHCLCSAGAQEYRAFARCYSIEEGLPHRQVNCLIQDRRGLVWAATNGGVACFDGRRFRVFNQSESGLGGDIVDWVAEDAAGYIWACRYGPNHWLRIIEPVSGKMMTPEEYFKKYPMPVSTEFWHMVPEKTSDGTLLITSPTEALIWSFHPETGWKRIAFPDCTYLMVLKVTSRHTIWAIFGDRNNFFSLVETTLEGQILRRIPVRPGYRFWPKKGEALHPDGFMVLEFVMGDLNPVLWEVDETGEKKEALLYVQNKFIPQHARLESGRIEVQFPLILDQDGQVLLDISRQFPQIDPLQYRYYLRDKNGNIWFATTFGLVVVELRKNLFRRLLFDEHAPGGRGKACRGLLEMPDGHLLVNTETYGQGRWRVDPHTGNTEQLPGFIAMGIGRSSDGNVWTHCDNTGGWGNISLHKSAPDGHLIEQNIFQKRAMGFIWAILEEDPQRILLGHGNGITIFHPQTTALEPWKDPTFPVFDQANINWLGKDRSGQIWACAEQGLFQLKPGGGVAQRYWSGGKGETYLPHDNILHFYEDPAGIFWLGTSGGGLMRWDRKAPANQQIQVIFRKNGMLNGVVYAVYEDRHEHLWLPTDYGIVQLDKKTLQVRHTWLTADGLTHNEFNRTSHCQGADGTLYFGGLNGVTAFQPDEFYAEQGSDQNIYPLVVSSFSVFDERSRTLINALPDLLKTNEITMYPGDRYFQLEFALLDYVAPEKVTYTWKLEGVSADWETLKEPVLRLSSLPFGAHALRIRAQAADGSWAGNELNIRLTVLPPLYLRGWFIALALLLAAASVWGWMHWRTREHRREQERLELEVARQTATIRHQTEELTKLDQAKSRFFANVSHELRTPLTLMLGPLSSMLKGNRLETRDFSYAKVAQQHGQQLLQLVNEILDLSKIESGKMKLHETTVSLQPFLRRLVSAFESHAERLGILFVFEYQLSERLRVLADEDKLQKVMNNLLANALKFTPAHGGGSVKVQVSEASGHIRIAVRDTGRGIHPDDLPHVFERFYQTAQADIPMEGGTGIGLALCREFADLMQGRIWVESTWGEGSCFYFEFPKKEVLGVGKDELMMNGGMMNDELGMMKEVSLHDSSFLLPPSSLKKQTVLLVEDNDSLRDYVKSILSEKYHVVTATHGQEALAFLNSTEAERIVHRSSFLIISDIMMPFMDGFQLLEALKGDDRWRSIPVVMLTARADMRDKLRALRIGVDDYLLKPFEEDELLARVENLLKNQAERVMSDEVGVRSYELGVRSYEVGVMSDEVGDMVSNPKPGAEHITHHSYLITSEEIAWLEAFEQLVNQRLGDFHLTADMLAEAMAMSRAPFFRQLKRLTGLTPAQYLDEARFQKARSLFENRESSSVKAVAYTVGFRQVKHFSQNYKKRFGKLPSEYAG